MSKSSPTASINCPPFPQLHWAEYSWEGEVILPAWAGFQSRGGAYGSRDSTMPSQGIARLNVSSQDERNPVQPSPAQCEAFARLLLKQSEYRDVMLASLLERYPRWRTDWKKAMDAEDFKNFMPTVAAPEGFQNLIGLSCIHVSTVEKDGLAYIGFELGCTWDREHGLGFMMHSDRVVQLGGADTSFLEWIAERDLKERGT